jgi:Protein of unknown function (DUF3072)
MQRSSPPEIRAPGLKQRRARIGGCFAFLSCMTTARQNRSNRALQKDPDDWKTGGEPMTPAQQSYLETLAHDTGEQAEADLTKAEASKKIDELREKSPRVKRDE